MHIFPLVQAPTVILLACVSAASLNAQEIIEDGEASWYASIPDGLERPSDTSGNAVLPAVTDSFSGPIPTNDWWTSLLWRRYAGANFGSSMFPMPFALQCDESGLLVLRPTVVHQSSVAYYNVMSNAHAALTIGVDGLVASEVRVHDHTDWTVTAEWTDDTRTLRTTFGHGLPYVFAQITGGRAVVDPNENLGDFSLLENDGFAALFSVGGAVYGAYAPEGATWEFVNGRLEADVADGAWISVGALPVDDTNTRTLFRAHAHARITNTTVSWDVDEENAVVRNTFSASAENANGDAATPLLALFRHQWIYSDAPTLSATYSTVRGEMRLAAASSFTADVPLNGFIPAFPENGQFDTARLEGYLDEALASDDLVTAPDTYWNGKQLGRVAQLLQIAHARGDDAARDRLLGELREDVEDWLSVGTQDDGSTNSAFDQIEAEDGQASGSTGNTGEAVTGIGDGDSIEFNSIDFASNDATGMTLRIASGVGTGGSAMVRLRLGAIDGPVLAEGALGNTGGWDAWTEIPFGVSKSVMSSIEGEVTLVLECETGYSGDVFNLDWIRFEGGGGSSSGGDSKFMAYDSTWNTTLAYPGSYGSISELNDHHFHYGYLISAAATIAQFDPDWADDWAGGVTMLIRDAANADRSDERFPFLRNFDPYMGYAYASGHQGFANGNNQESSSESINFSAAVAHWGAVIGDESIRDLGLYLHAVESTAIDQYWFDADDVVFPQDFAHPLLGIVWNNGGDYATWWTANPEEIHGINLLPITTASLHLGRRPAVIARNHAYLIERNGGEPTVWRDILWSAQAMDDASVALQSFDNAPTLTSEPGESRAHTYHWLASLAAFGQLDTSVHADTAHAVVFKREDTGARTHIAWNPRALPMTVRFTDGVVGCVAAGATVVVTNTNACTQPADLNNDGTVDGADLVILLGNWNTANPIADLNNDGTVDGADLAHLLAAWS